MEIRYFAWVRERIGKSGEHYEGRAQTIAELLNELEARSEFYASAFGDRQILRFAIDQDISELDASILDAREVAIFPPMTGG